MASASVASAGTSPSSEVVFGNLLDLVVVRTGAMPAEICEACSTINLGSSRFCKGCSHKLPAFYAESAGAQVLHAGQQGLIDRPWARVSDLAAFWLVINGLAVVTAVGPLM